MDCELCLDQLSAYCDGQLDENEMNTVKAHLESCESCQEEYEALQYMIEVLKQPVVVEMPQALHEQMMAKIKSEGKPVVKWKGYFKGGSLIAASLIMALCITQGSSLWWHQEQLTQGMEKISQSAALNETAESEMNDQSIAVATVEDSLPSLAKGRMVEGVFSEWQIETQDQAATCDFLIDFCETHHLMGYVEDGVFIIEAVEDGKALEKALNDLAFVEKVKIIEASGENIKISMIEP